MGRKFEKSTKKSSHLKTISKTKAKKQAGQLVFPKIGGGRY